MTSDKNYTGWYFLLGVVLLYIITFFINPTLIYESLSYFGKLMINIIPTVLIIFLLMAVTNYFIKPKTIAKYVGNNSGIKGLLITIVGGIISTGPIYMWYPLLQNLQQQGMKTSLIATFLYNRAIKIPLLPLLITYFGVKYCIILFSVMILMSILQGWVTEKLMEVRLT